VTRLEKAAEIEPNRKVALNLVYRIFLNFAKSCILSFLPKLDNKKKFHRAVFEIAKFKVFLASHTVAMVAYSVIKMMTMCLPMIGQFFDTMNVASIDNEW